jgi:hypothetical protein
MMTHASHTGTLMRRPPKMVAGQLGLFHKNEILTSNEVDMEQAGRSKGLKAECALRAFLR